MKILLLLLLVAVYFLFKSYAILAGYLISGLLVFWISCVIVFILYKRVCKIKLIKHGNSLNLRDIPQVRTITELGYLLNGKITPSMLGVSIMELVRKKALLLRYNPDNKDYIFLHNDAKSKELTSDESYLINWLFKIIGSGEKVSLSLMKREAITNSTYFLSCYNNWNEVASIEGAKSVFFETKKQTLNSVFGYIGLSILLAFLGMITHQSTFLIVFSLIATLILIIYIDSFYMRTKYGNEEYSRWISFSHSIKRGDISKNITDLTSIGRIVVYATLLRRKFDVSLSKMLENSNHAFDNDEFIVSVRCGAFDEVCSKINKLVPRALVVSFFFSKNKGCSSAPKYSKNKEM